MYLALYQLFVLLDFCQSKSKVPLHLLDNTGSTLNGRGITTGKGLVKGDNVDHTLGVRSSAKVLQIVSIKNI